MLRPLVDTEFDVAARLLAEGFPNRSAAGWADVLARMAEQSVSSGADRPLGQLMFAQGEAVGVGLTPTSLRRRDDGTPYRLVNVSSLYVRPEYRWRAGLMLKAMVADPQATYIDLTPSEEIRRMLPLLGFAPVSQGTWVTALPAQAWRRTETAARLTLWREGDALAPTDPPASQLRAHQALGGVAIQLREAQDTTLLVYARRRIRGLPGARLLYVGSHRALQRQLSALARHLLARGIAVLSWDARHGQTPRFGQLLRPGGVWYSRGDRFEDRSDFIGSEVCLLGL